MQCTEMIVEQMNKFEKVKQTVITISRMTLKEIEVFVKHFLSRRSTEELTNNLWPEASNDIQGT